MQTYRWSLLGNAVSVQVAEWLGQRLAQAHIHKYCLGQKDRQFATPAAYKDEMPGKLLSLAGLRATWHNQMNIHREIYA